MAIVVQVRGASGSGKSTLVRQWVEEHGPASKYMMSGAANFGLGHIDCAASRPYALACPVAERTPVIVPGHYEAPGGGADMIKSVYHIYDVCDQALFWQRNVLVEGLFLAKDVKALQERYPPPYPYLHVLYLDLPEEVCYESVMQRREALGKERRPLRAHANDFRGVRTAVRILEEKGYQVERFQDRDACAARVREILG